MIKEDFRSIGNRGPAEKIELVFLDMNRKNVLIQGGWREKFGEMSEATFADIHTATFDAYV